MFEETKNILSSAAVKKVAFLKNSLGRYLVASSWAGTYVGLGIILIMVVGSIGATAGSPFTKGNENISRKSGSASATTSL